MSESQAYAGVPAFWSVEDEDNVATCIKEGGATAGEEATLSVGGHPKGSVTPVRGIAYGHKIALRPIAQGEHIIKYGMSLGVAMEDIPAGEHVHVHNIESERGRGDRAAEQEGPKPHTGPWARWSKQSDEQAVDA